MAPNGSPIDPTLIVFAALAVFVIWRLRSVLGVRVEREDTPSPQFDRRMTPDARAPLRDVAPAHASAAKPETSPERRWEGVAEKGAAEAWSGLDAILAADPRFDGAAFLDGARRAYEMIVEAFAKGDRERLQGLLSKSVFDGFAREIERRESAGETQETAVVAIDSATVQAARAAPGLNEITVRYANRLMTVRRASDGETIDGGYTRSVVELWTFARDPNATDPNWKLVATKSES